jgi:capsid protein
MEPEGSRMKDSAVPESDKPAAEAVRAFASYTTADHARVAMAEVAWSTLEAAFRAIVPEAHRPDGVPPTVLLEAALWARARAQDLVRAAVIASHERGLSWTQIGKGLGTSKQAAHERFAGEVTAFRKQLAALLAALAEDPDAKPEKPEGFEHGWGLVPNTAFLRTASGRLAGRAG